MKKLFWGAFEKMRHLIAIFVEPFQVVIVIYVTVCNNFNGAREQHSVSIFNYFKGKTYTTEYKLIRTNWTTSDGK